MSNVKIGRALKLAVWLFAALAIITLPIISCIYWDRELASGTLPADGDSIGIPIFGSFLLTLLIVAPLVIGVTVCTLQPYSASYKTSRWWLWRTENILLVITLLIAAGGAYSTGEILALHLPQHEHLFTLWDVALMGWLWLLRKLVLKKKAILAL